MLILSHRGYWLNAFEKNQPIAFKRSFDLGFGTETDVRDCAGRLVISHDMPTCDALDLDDFLQIYAQNTYPLAINIKADGLIMPLKRAMRAAHVTDWFVFDMSIPDMRQYLQAGVSVFARMSEVEQSTPWMEKVAGIWLDGFSGPWYSLDLIRTLLNKNLRVCIVSPELHGLTHEAFWTQLKPISGQDGLMLCTDFPEQAAQFFERKECL